MFYQKFVCVTSSQDGWGNNETRDVAEEEGSAFQVRPTRFVGRVTPRCMSDSPNGTVFDSLDCVCC